jgi:hypothetical protein
MATQSKLVFKMDRLLSLFATPDSPSPWQVATPALIAFFAALVTVLGSVAMALRSIENSRRLASDQLIHLSRQNELDREHESKQREMDRRSESDQKKTDREMLFRKEVYAEATEAFVTAGIVIGRLSDLSVPSGQIINSFVEKYPAVGKAQLFAGPELMRATAALSVEVVRALLALQLKRVEVEGENDQRLRAQSLEALRKECLDRSQAISLLASDALLAARKELEIEGGEDELRLILRDARAKISDTTSRVSP